MDIQIPAYIETRIRQRKPDSIDVVRGSTPVVAFGDVRKAGIATLGLNPSKVEFVDRYGNEWTGNERRLETLLSLREWDLSAASPDAIRKVFEGCNSYFQRCPYRKWFDVLEKLLRKLGASYYNHSACHLDLVQWATDLPWGKLPAIQRKSLIAADLSFLRQQLSRESIRILLLNGSGVVNACTNGLGFVLPEKAIPGKTGWKLFVGSTSDGVKIIGWNKNLQAPYSGVSNNDIAALGAAIEKEW